MLPSSEYMPDGLMWCGSIKNEATLRDIRHCKADMFVIFMTNEFIRSAPDQILYESVV
jgi:hypothetical protein